MNKTLCEKDCMAVTDMSQKDLMEFTKEELVEAVSQFAEEAHSWESKCTNIADDYTEIKRKDDKRSMKKTRRLKNINTYLEGRLELLCNSTSYKRSETWAVMEVIELKELI